MQDRGQHLFGMLCSPYGEVFSFSQSLSGTFFIVFCKNKSAEKGSVFVSLRRDKSGKKTAHLLSCPDSPEVIKSSSPSSVWSKIRSAPNIENRAYAINPLLLSSKIFSEALSRKAPATALPVSPNFSVTLTPPDTRTLLLPSE